MILITAITACGDSPSAPKPSSLDAALQATADAEQLQITDISVPFERLAQAPAQLQTLNRAIEKGPAAVYVMRYFDDTLRHTLHVFVIGDTKRVYVRLSAAPYEDVTREQHDIHTARYEEKEKSLILETPAGVIRLGPQDVTPVGA